MKKIFFLLIFLAQACSVAQAFVVKNIVVQGLQRTSTATVESYLPIKRGQSLKASQSGSILRTLYKTGFFETISLEQEGNTLIIHVTERPTIGQLKITGNSIIPTDKLKGVMQSLDIAEGRIYNAAVVERISQSLLSQYYQLGRYNARVNVHVTPMSRNRVRLTIEISEGLVAKIKRISIIGNNAFDEKTLIKQLTITTSGLFTLLSQTDRYSEARLEESLENLRNFYLDHGYIKFEVKSAQAEVTPDRKSVYVNIVINEGPQYTIENYTIEGDDLLYPREEYMKLITLQPGEVFSRQKIIDSEKTLTKFLGEKGYMFATISLKPNVNEKSHQINLIFNVVPGKRTYVRNVTFSENTRTNDIVLRREIEQMEAAPASTTKIEESKHKLSLLPYIKEVDMSLKPVPDKDDQVDINYKVKEDSAGQVSFKIGYQKDYGFVIGAGLNQKNFLGTGNTFGINLSRSRYEQFYGVEFTDPYYTEDGISRSFNASISKTNPSAIRFLNNGYAINQYDLGVLFGIPIGQETGAYNRIMVGADYQNILIHLNRKNVSNQVNSFISRHGRRFQELDLKLGYSRDSRDKAIFPTSGSLQTLYFDLYLPLSKRSLTFYTLNYSGKWYQPITEQFIFLARTDLGYGNSSQGARNFPFFKNFYAGGIDSVRGYSALSLGPRDSNYQAYGGNMLFDASVALIFPNYISDSLRTSLFVDAGNVYSTLNNRNFGCNNAVKHKSCSTNSGPPRFSIGLEADWITPFGPIELSLAKPFRRKHDQMDVFQFALGANF